MIHITAKLSSKNQVTIPAAVRERLGLEAHQKIAFVLTDTGTVELQPAPYTLDQVLGSLTALRDETADLDLEIQQATVAELARKAERSR